ncbi:hypothetical protein WCQ02_19880 [Paraburkholderia tropica]|uniref:hypothetical protein n=1 Tax=Paraburkholderia tropica TaxID=92647 RepID=UPI003017B51C
MAVKCPPRYSVWENDKGGKIFVEDAIEVDGTFFVTIVPYADRNDIDVWADEVDDEQWAELIETDGIRQTGIEPPDSN